MNVYPIDRLEELSIDTLYRMISNEDLIESKPNLFNIEYYQAMSRVMVAQFTQAYKKIVTLINTKDYIKVIPYNIKKLDKQLNTYKYVDLSELIIYRPIGLKVPYIELINALEAVQSDVLTIDERILTPYSKWCGEIINSPKKIERITINQQFEFINSDNYNKVLDKLFDPDDTRDRVNYGSLFKSNKQVIDSMVMLNDVVERQNDLPAKKLLNMVQTSAMRTEILTQRCSDKNISGICSTASKKIIADVLYDIAKEITLYSRLSFLIISTANALSESIDKILSLR